MNSQERARNFTMVVCNKWMDLIVYKTGIVTSKAFQCTMLWLGLECLCATRRGMKTTECKTIHVRGLASRSREIKPTIELCEQNTIGGIILDAFHYCLDVSRMIFPVMIEHESAMHHGLFYVIRSCSRHESGRASRHTVSSIGNAMTSFFIFTLEEKIGSYEYTYKT